MPDPMSAFQLRQHGALARSQLRPTGTRGAYDHAVRGGLLLPRHRGVAGTLADDPAARAWAALLTQAAGGAVPAGVAVSHTTAARLWQLDGIPTDPDEHVTVPRDSGARHRPGVRLHRARLVAGDYGSMGGLMITSAARTVLDVARAFDRTTGVVLADSALRAGRCTTADLLAALDPLAGLRHVERARTVVALCDPGTDSCQETRLRLIIVDGGLPRPQTGVRLLDGRGSLLARADLAYELLLIWIEYDGYEPHIERAQFRRDRARTRWLEADRGWVVLTYSDADLLRPAALVAQLGRLIAAAPRRIAALDPRMSPDVRAARAALGLR